MHGYAQKLDEKSELINKNMSVVKKIAYYYLGRVHQVVEVEDLLQIGMVGLIEAAHNYEPHEGVVFESYASLRVKGAIGLFAKVFKFVQGQFGESISSWS